MQLNRAYFLLWKTLVPPFKVRTDKNSVCPVIYLALCISSFNLILLYAAEILI